MDKTVVAISTAPARGAIAIVRLSGDDAISIADKVFRAVSGKRLLDMKGYTAAYGEILCDGAVIDDGVATVYLSPKSYTGEDMVEISCHGNPLIATQLMSECIRAGAFPAGAGEFTKRSFLNGKIDLTRAEAVAELISAQGRGAARLALSKRSGALEKKIDAITASLTSVAAKIAVWVDYPDDETMSVEHSEVHEVANICHKQLAELISGYSKAVMVSQGLSAAIVGRPNAGKSTTMNLLCQSDRSIVSQYPGTTRDVVEGIIEVGSTTLKLLDTAGIRQTDDPIESLGVERAIAQIELADIVIMVLDGSEKLTQEEKTILADLKHRVAVVLINKQDISQSEDVYKAVSEILPKIELYNPKLKDDENTHSLLILPISALKGQGEQELRDAIELAVGLCGSGDNRLIANERQLSCVLQAQKAVEVLLDASHNLETLDAISLILDDALNPLWDLVGKNASEAVINEVFSKFCVGK